MMNAWDAVSTLDRMFDDVMGSAFGTATQSKAFEPAIDVRVDEEAIVLVCDVPGVRREDLEITLENRVLTIKGARKFDGKVREHVILGRAHGSFSRAFTLPGSIDEEHLTAELADGVLTVRVPKHPKAQPRKIAISGAKQLGG